MRIDSTVVCGQPLHEQCVRLIINNANEMLIIVAGTKAHPEKSATGTVSQSTMGVGVSQSKQQSKQHEEELALGSTTLCNRHLLLVPIVLANGH